MKQPKVPKHQHVRAERRARFAYHLWDHVVPNERNHHKPHLLRHRVLLGYSLTLILLKTLLVAAAVALPSSNVLSSAITVQNILTLTNAARSSLGVPALRLEARLTQAAQAKAADMLQYQYFAHTSPAGVKPWDWIRNAGYSYASAGENLAVHYVTAEDTQGGWIASPTHRSNIMNSRYTETGIGISNGLFEGYPSILVVQLFGTPKTKPSASTSTKPIPLNQAKNPPTIKPPAPVQKRAVQSAPSAAAAVLGERDESEAADAAAAASSSAPTINASSVQIVDLGDAYRVEIGMSNTERATLQLGTQQTELTRVDGDRWKGSVAYDRNTTSPNGDYITLTAWGDTTSSTTIPLALVAPRAQTQDVYAFARTAPNEPRLFGIISLPGLQDSVRQTYLLFIIMLTAALLINIFVKIYIQHYSVIAHAVAVIFLAVLLAVL